MHSPQDRSLPAAGGDAFERQYWRSAPATPQPLPTLRAGAVGDDEFRLLADNIPTLCWLANGDGYIVWYNRRWHDYCGTTPKEMEGWGWQSVHDPALLPQVMERWTSAVATGEPFEMTFPLKGADGVFRPFLTRVTPVRDSSGAVARWFGVNTEISAQIAAEDALRESETRFASLFEQAPTFMAMLRGPEHVFELANPSYDKLIGHREVIGRTVADALPDAVAQGYLELLDGVYRTGRPYAASGARYAAQAMPDGPIDERYVDFVYQPITDKTGAVTGIFVEGFDVTERKQAEAKVAAASARHEALGAQQAAILGQLDEGVIVADREGRLTFVNEAAERLHGVKSLDVTPDAYSETYHLYTEAGDPYPPAELPLARAVTRGETVLDARWRIRRPDGTEIVAIGSARPILDSGGTQIGSVLTLRDDTERRRGEEAVRASEERLRLVVDGATDHAIFTTDPERRITSWSKGAASIFGYSAEEAIGQPADLIFTPEDRAARQPEHEVQTARDEGCANDERWHLRADGSRVYMNGSTHPLPNDADRREQGFIKIARDDTERQLAAAALRDKEAQLRLVLDSAAGGFYSVDREGVTTACSRGFLTMLGFASEAEAVGRKLHGLIHHTHPDGLHYEVSDCPIYRAASSAVSEHVADELFFRLDGTPVPVEYWATPIFRDGEHVGAVCTSLDITERKAAEDALRELNATLERRVEERTRDLDRAWRLSEDLLVVAGPDGTLLEVNASWTRLLGWEPQQLIGKQFVEFTHPDDLEATLAAFAGIFEAPLTQPYEYRLQHRDGSYRWFGWTGAFEDGFVYAAGRHTTSEREQAIALEQAQEALRQSQKMEAVGQLTGGIAHDFNNLLTVVIGNLDMGRRSLDANGGDARTRRSIENALKGAERAAALTQRLLAFARRQPLAPKPLDADKLVLGMSDLLNRSLGETIKLEIVTSPGLWRIEADPNQLEAAILNLAVNARDAMPEGGKLSIATANAVISEGYSSAHPDVAPGSYIVVTVGDNGQGMAKATLERVFEPFFTTKAVGKGTGLGLSQVYGFVKQSGGHVTLYSEEGQGTTVRIYLPRLAVEGEIEEEAPAADIELSGAEETLLVVEDDDDVRAYTVSLLREIGYRVLEAHDGPSALRLLEREDSSIDLLFTDVVMPGMSGRELADEARRQQPNLRVLFTSGYTKDAIVHGGRLDPGVDLVAKPFTYQTLARKVRDMLETGRSGRMLVVDGDPARHAAIVSAVAGGGHAVDRSDTPTEALGRVRANGGRYDFIIIDTGTEERSGETLAAQLRALHCDLPILLVAGDDADALRSRFAGDRCIGVVAKPYAPDALLRSLAELGVECARQAESSGAEPA